LTSSDIDGNITIMMKNKTQQVVYLDPEQKTLLRVAAHQRGVSEAQIIRDALNKYLESARQSLDKFFSGTFGGWRHRRDLPSGVEYEREMRREWVVREREPRQVKSRRKP
jgi:hypothetical protein